MAENSPIEDFRQAVAASMRALGHAPDMELAYTADKPGCFGDQARVPQPARALPPLSPREPWLRGSKRIGVTVAGSSRQEPPMVSIRVRTVLIVAFVVASGMPLLTFWAWPHSSALQAEMKSANDRHLLLALNAAEDLQDYHANVAETVRAGWIAE